MSTFLFHNTVFGPIFSRRLGISLGINLLPSNVKYCNFSCIYCECGWSQKIKNIQLPKRNFVYSELKKRLCELKEKNKPLHSITFAGNGEPTIHPEFAKIIDDVIELRNEYYPQALVSVLSNATMLKKKEVCEALKKTDKPIMKLDAGDTATFHKINQPLSKIPVEKIVDNLKCFEGNFIMQSLFVRGYYKNEYIDNSNPEAIEKWLEKVKILQPQEVMIYTIARDTPVETLEKVPQERLQEIGKLVEQLGIKTLVV